MNICDHSTLFVSLRNSTSVHISKVHVLIYLNMPLTVPEKVHQSLSQSWGNKGRLPFPTLACSWLKHQTLYQWAFFAPPLCVGPICHLIPVVCHPCHFSGKRMYEYAHLQITIYDSQKAHSIARKLVLMVDHYNRIAPWMLSSIHSFWGVTYIVRYS